LRSIAGAGNTLSAAGGLNDLILRRELPVEERVRRCLDNMRQARDLSLSSGIKVIFAPQPFLPQKPVKSGLEALLQVQSYRPVDELVKAYADLRRGLQVLCMPGRVFYMDCSGVFDSERRTVFSDMWHFSDVGHALLGSYMANKLDPILYTGRDEKTG